MQLVVFTNTYACVIKLKMALWNISVTTTYCSRNGRVISTSGTVTANYNKEVQCMMEASENGTLHKTRGRYEQDMVQL